MIDANTKTNTELDVIAAERDNPSGAAVLGQVYDFLGRFVVYPSEHARVAHALWIAHVHMIEAFESTPRLAFLSAEPASGKTRALEITELLVPRPIEAVNMSPAALFRLVGDEAGLPTILYDEIDTVFGPKAKEHEEIRGLLNAGHRRGAKTYRCVMNGKKAEVEHIEAFAPVALAGLGWLPDTIVSRAILIRMKRRAPNECVEAYRRRDFIGEGHAIQGRVHRWCEAIAADIRDARPELPSGIVDRAADVWEPLVAVADAAGGTWPDRVRTAAIAIVKDAATDHLPSLGVQLLSDLRALWGDEPVKPTDDILDALRSIPESPWPDMKGKPIDARKLASLLRQYGIKSRTVRVGEQTPKGYVREDFADAWDRNLAPLPGKSATSATSATSEGNQAVIPLRMASDVADVPPHVADPVLRKPLQNGHVADVADVAAISGKAALRRMTCAHCGRTGGEILTIAEPSGDVRLHRHCIDEWVAGDIPPALDRRATRRQEPPA